MGFKDVDAQDATVKFVDCLKMELTRMESIKNDFIQVYLYCYALPSPFLFIFQGILKR